MTRRIGALAIAALSVAAALSSVRAAGGAPRGLHVAFGADPRSQATITWFTDGEAPPDPTAVEYGLAPSLGLAVEARMQAAPGMDYPSGAVTVHEATLTGLPSDTEVFYRVGDDGGWSGTYSFRTAPDETDAFTFTAFGDHGVKPQSVAATDAVIAAEPAFHLIAGDLSYAYHGDGSFPSWSDWDVWFDQLQPLAARTPVMAALGNHEMESVGGTDSFTSRLAQPLDETTYSFDYGTVHVLVWNSDRNAGLQEQRLAGQLAVAAEDLADAAARRDAGEIDFIVVLQHHPLYGIGDSALENELLERHYNPYLIATEEALLHANGVDLLITAHNHHYARSYPMRLGRPTSTAPAAYTTGDDLIQVTTGGGGQGLQAMLSQDQWPDWVAAAARRFHITEFRVDGPTLTVTARATDGGTPAVLDTFTITRAP